MCLCDCVCLCMYVLCVFVCMFLFVCFLFVCFCVCMCMCFCMIWSVFYEIEFSNISTGIEKLKRYVWPSSGFNNCNNTNKKYPKRKLQQQEATNKSITTQQLKRTQRDKRSDIMTHYVLYYTVVPLEWGQTPACSILTAVQLIHEIIKTNLPTNLRYSLLKTRFGLQISWYCKTIMRNISLEMPWWD